MKRRATRDPIRRKVFLSLTAALFLLPLQPVRGDSYAESVAQFLNQTVTWYRRVEAERALASTARDAVFVNDNAQVSDQIVRLAFDFARSEVQAEKAARQGSQSGSQSSPSSSSSEPSPPSQYQALVEMSRKMDSEVQQTEQELESLRRQVDSATGRKREDLQASIAETQSQLQLFDARRDILHTMVEFVGSTAEGKNATGLSAQIEALSHSVPNALSEPSETTSRAQTAGRTPEINSAPAVSIPTKPEPEGLWGLIATIVAASRKMHALEQDIQETNGLLQEAKQLQTPLIGQLREMAKQGDTIATQSDAATRAGLTQDKGELDRITGQFKVLSASFVPLGKQAILLDLYSRNLATWRNAVKDQYSSDLKALLLRLSTLLLILAMIWGVAEVWRRAIFRYIREARRRYQMLLLRRIAMWFAIMLVFIFSFASELGSLATFAGLLTAGVAVALQNVILSVAGYFFLIGKFGVRVGDRVQIAGVVGEVVEIGLVRIHVMELGVNGRDVQPTGRVVAFSNSFVFQPMAGMFKQIPGTNFVWHEITLTLASDSDYRSVEERMIKAMDSAFANYHDTLEQQRVLLESNLGSVNIAPLQPRTSLKLTPAGLEVRVSFPAQTSEAHEIDDRVTREILKELDRDPKLKIVGSDMPTIRQIAGPETKAGA
jgi:small-conductance mechanosensitive channel